MLPVYCFAADMPRALDWLILGDYSPVMSTGRLRWYWLKTMSDEKHSRGGGGAYSLIWAI